MRGLTRAALLLAPALAAAILPPGDRGENACSG